MRIELLPNNYSTCLLPIFVALLIGISRTDAELVSTAVGIGSAAVIGGFIAGYELLKCRYYECCDKSWIPNNVPGMELELKSRLYGQHLVTETVVRAVKRHLANPMPAKALTMSFHGWTGGGKNYVTQMLANNLYQKGMKSQYVHLFVSGLDFGHKLEVELYKKQLSQWIRGNVSLCAQNLFIFDEMDKLQPEVIDAIKPFIDYYDTLQGLDYRKSIFLFLSNTGGNDITANTLEHWKNGQTRESVTLQEMERSISLAGFNEKGGLRFSELISSHLIDHFIPFLPLERKHVKLCARDYFRDNHQYYNAEDEWLTKVVDMLQYFPSEHKLFSTSGCKRVAAKAELLLETLEEEERQKRRASTSTDDNDEL